MGSLRNILYALCAYVVVSEAVIFKPQNGFQEISGANLSFPVDLRPWFNNRAFGLKPNESDFDGEGGES